MSTTRLNDLASLGVGLGAGLGVGMSAGITHSIGAWH
jgi:hypothetical protein